MRCCFIVVFLSLVTFLVTVVVLAAADAENTSNLCLARQGDYDDEARLITNADATCGALLAEKQQVMSLSDELKEEGREDKAEEIETEKEVDKAQKDSSSNVHIMMDDGSDMGVPQEVHAESVAALISATRTYVIHLLRTTNSDPLHDDNHQENLNVDYALCKNQDAKCAFWASIGECTANPGYMHIQCAPVCQTCEQLMLTYNSKKSNNKTSTISSQKFSETDHGSDMGIPQEVKTESVAALIVESRRYMTEIVAADPRYEKSRSVCLNQHASCASWASIGECTANPKYMKVHCAPVCQSCELVHASDRCKLNPDAIDALYPGDLHRMFERIVTDPVYAPYQPKVLSRPDLALGDTVETANYAVGGLWVVQFDALSSDEECDALIAHGARKGYNRSADVGEELPDGSFGTSVNQGRTSTNAWCDTECVNDPIAHGVVRKMEHLTGINASQAESLQLLRYEPGQFYNTHNDYIPYQIHRPTGVRILTFFLYLNDVDEGGATDFPRLGIHVTPRKGRAVLWPSVLNEFPNFKDGRSDHQALPVVRGIKYGANAWIHMRDVQNLEYDCL